MKPLLLVILGGGIGSGLRYLVSQYLNPLISGFYLGTFLVNVVGCLLIGLLLGTTLRTGSTNPAQAALLATGFCGGFTTFSTFGLEQFLLLKQGSYLPFLAYSLGSIALGIGAVMLGFWLARFLA
ncbi:fluoride efflux transporter CrcB [Robiginitalea sp. M366]|uniref:fluoride efflux transporter CrcB n=1 Tax=Robiginitalea aestuariiviva TaxID=3036903 RepID=UPI00240DD454|nr:fluoride efflux transporter CrcB [Robiginitalea aestuariiviva]MDG1572298.1 fluoride efflux transporter CrcB [Robiginitalea aestuariiviva]